MRTHDLLDCFKSRKLESSTEGLRRGSWKYPENMCSTIGNDLELRTAVEELELKIIALIEEKREKDGK